MYNILHHITDLNSKYCKNFLNKCGVDIHILFDTRVQIERNKYLIYDYQSITSYSVNQKIYFYDFVP